MNALEILYQEHTIILDQLEILEAILNRTEKGEELPLEDIKKLIDFLKGFADERHHGKEEQILFPGLESVGIKKQQGPLGVMIYEHNLGRGLIQEIQSSFQKVSEGDFEAKNIFIRSSRNYIELLRKHILKENNILFPMAGKALSENQLADLTKKFESFELIEVQSGRDKYFMDLVQELKSSGTL